MHRVIVVATCLALPACVHHHALRYAGDALIVADDELPRVAEACSDQGITLGRDATLVLELDGRRDLVPGPLRLTREPGVLYVDESYGQRSYPDESLRSLSYETPDVPATVAFVTVTVVASIAASILWVHAFEHMGEL